MRFRVARRVIRNFEERWIAQSNPTRFAVFTCNVVPTPTIEGVAVVLADNADAKAQRWFAAIAQGIQQALPEYQQRGIQYCGLQIVVTKAIDHPIDSREEAFAALSASVMWSLASNVIESVAPPPFALLTPDVIGVARAIAEDHTLAHPILADALEEAGCEDTLILEHLRTCADHGPSCWVTTWLLQQLRVDPLGEMA